MDATTTAPADWRREYAKVLRWLVTVPAVVTVLLAAALTGTATHMDFVTDPSGTYAADLAHDRGCWTESDPAPANVIPGHAVIMHPDGTPEYVGPVVTGRALDAVFEGTPMPGGDRPYAFCR